MNLNDELINFAFALMPLAGLVLAVLAVAVFANAVSNTFAGARADAECEKAEAEAGREQQRSDRTRMEMLRDLGRDDRRDRRERRSRRAERQKREAERNPTPPKSGGDGDIKSDTNIRAGGTEGRAER